MHSQPFKLFSCCFLLLSLKTRFWKWHNKASNFVRTGGLLLSEQRLVAEILQKTHGQCFAQHLQAIATAATFRFFPMFGKILNV